MGGGIHGHPDGTLRGANAARQAVDAVLKGQSLKDYSKAHIELRRAIELWGIGKKGKEKKKIKKIKTKK